uniref:Uncharacterized protein n=1 Tax=Setaria italica TaxID=4555 RepID=K3XP88_SETIT
MQDDMVQNREKNTFPTKGAKQTVLTQLRVPKIPGFGVGRTKIRLRRQLDGEK